MGEELRVGGGDTVDVLLLVPVCVPLAVPVWVADLVAFAERVAVLVAVPVEVPVMSCMQKETLPSTIALVAPTLRTLALRRCVPDTGRMKLSCAHSGAVCPLGSTLLALYSSCE